MKWAGGKSGLLNLLIDKFPSHFERYVEPFFGSGACFLALEKNTPALLNDANPELIHLYRVVRQKPLKLMDTLDKLAKRYSETFYYRLRNSRPKDPVLRAARTVFLNKTGFNGLYRQNSKGEFNVPFGKRPKCPRLYSRESLLLVSRRLRTAKLSQLDFEKLLDLCGAGDFVYCDPPYAPLTPTSSFTNYTASKFDQSEQIRLRNAASRAAKRGATIAISNSSADLIYEIYRGCQITRIPARRAINSKGNLRGKIDEVLVLFH